MGLANNCYECEFYIPSPGRQGVGVCNRADDPDFCYAVLPELETCLWEIPGGALSEENINVRSAEVERKYERSRAAAERARQEIERWPEWKKNLFG